MSKEPYDPKSHVWQVGDWFIVTRITDWVTTEFVKSYGYGPHKVAGINGNRSVWCAWPGGRHSNCWFWPSEIRPCSAPVANNPVPVHPSPNVTITGGK